MLNTYTRYQLITRDIEQSLDRVEKQPVVQRDTEYYLANIGKVKSAEEFVNDYRLFNYAMKAHGLGDMAYAKAFMLKALNEGVDDPNSFANKMIDKRYAEFVRSFNFAKHGENATVYALAKQPVVELYLGMHATPGNPPSEYHLEQSAHYAQNIGNVKSIDDFLHKDNERLLQYALQAFGLEDAFDDKAFLRKIFEGGAEDPESFANKQEDKAWGRFAQTFDFARLGEHATSFNLAQQPSVDKYLRQTLETNAGQESEGVRLALYFERKASEITNAYQILGDRALAAVVRTVLGLPDSVAQMDIDQQAKLLEARLNFEDFQDPAKLEKFLTRYTAMYDAQNPTVTPQSMLVSLFQPVEFGISQDTLMAIAAMKR